MDGQKQMVESYKTALTNRDEAVEAVLLPLMLGSLSKLEASTIRWIAAREFEQMTGATSRDLTLQSPGMSIHQASNLLRGLLHIGLLTRVAHKSNNGFYFSYTLTGTKLREMAHRWASDKDWLTPGSNSFRNI